MDTIEALQEEVCERIAQSDFQAVVAFEITDKNEKVIIDGDRRPPVADDSAQPKVTLSAKFETFAQYLKKKPNQMTLMTHIGTGKLAVNGSSGTAMAFLGKVL